jgi:hypothetical protein
LKFTSCCGFHVDAEEVEGDEGKSQQDLQGTAWLENSMEKAVGLAKQPKMEEYGNTTGTRNLTRRAKSNPTREVLEGLHHVLLSAVHLLQRDDVRLVHDFSEVLHLELELDRVGVLHERKATAVPSSE